MTALRCEQLPATARQLEVLAYIRRHIDELGYSPALRDIVSHFKWASTHNAAGHINALVRKGLLRRTSGIARSLVPVEATDG
jgi:repressor LexA